MKAALVTKQLFQPGATCCSHLLSLICAMSLGKSRCMWGPAKSSQTLCKSVTMPDGVCNPTTSIWCCARHQIC